MSVQTVSPEQQRNKEQRENYRKELMRAVANKTPVQIAADGVEKYFGAIMTSRDAVISGLTEIDLEDVFRHVECAIERDYVAEHRPSEDDYVPGQQLDEFFKRWGDHEEIVIDVQPLTITAALKELDRFRMSKEA